VHDAIARETDGQMTKKSGTITREPGNDHPKVILSFDHDPITAKQCRRSAVG